MAAAEKLRGSADGRLGFRALLRGVGCDWDDDDYSYKSENCTSIDHGGEEYELCCRLRCHGECDYDECHESCDEEFS